MRMDATMDAIEHVSEVRLSVRSRGSFNSDRKARLDQIDSRCTHWPENFVVLSQGAGETLLISTSRIEFTSRTIYRVAGVNHGRLELPLLPIINRVAY